MKKILGVFLSLFSVSLLFGCSGKEVISEEVETNQIVYTYLKDEDGMTSHDENVKFNYSAFNEPATKENKDIASLSFKLSWFTNNYVNNKDGKKDYSLGYKNIKDAYEGLGLISTTDAFYYSDGYSKKPTSDSVGFAIGRKEFDKTAVVVVSIRGFGYDSEWISNFEAGKTGDHKGFTDSSVKVIDGIKNYLNKVNKPNIKLLVTGYSRGGAIANHVGKLLVDGLNEYNKVSKDNMYIYSFNAPQSTFGNNDINLYNNIYVYYSKNDLVHHILPGIGFTNVGHEIDVYYDGFYDDLGKKYEFTKKDFSEAKFDLFNGFKLNPIESNINSPDLFLNKAFNMLFFKDDNPEVFSIGTRDKFMDNMFPTVKYIFTLVYDDNNDYLSAFKDINISELGVSKILGLLQKDSGALYQIVKELFDNKKLPYDEKELKGHCDIIQKVIYTYVEKYSLGILDIAASFIYNMNTILSHHYPEGFEVMLNHYINLK